MKSRVFVFILLFAVSALVGNEVIKQFTKEGGESKVANAATIKHIPLTEFSLSDTNGKMQEFKQWGDKVRVLNFWATWCPPCLRETPMFVELQAKYQAQGLQFIGVAIDSLEPVKDFMDTYGINYPILVGAEDAIDLSKKYGNKFGALPYSVVIDRNGTIVFVKSGEIKRENLEPLLKSLLSS
ncbi:MAG: TlpA family protein disulfide reductase [Thiohalomonadales bacterium]